MVEATSAAPDILQLFGLNGWLFLAQVINFAIVLFVLHRWVYKPLLAAMDARAEQVRAGVLKAEAAESVLREAQDRAGSVVRQAEQEAQSLLERTKAEAEAKRRELLQEAHQELDRQVATVKQQLEEERASMVKSAKKELAGLVVKATDAVTAEVLQDKEQRNLLEKAVKEVTS